jgi:hypothetical protein
MPLGEAARLCPLITKREQIHKHTTSELASFSSSGIREKEVLHVQFFIFSLALSTRNSFVSRLRHNKNKT